MSKLIIDKIVSTSETVISDSIVGVIIPSESGDEFPKLYTSFSELVRVYNTDKLDFTRYSLLFESGYSVCATKLVDKIDNYSSLRLNSNGLIPYSFPKLNYNYSPSSGQLDNISSYKLNHNSNNIILDFSNVTNMEGFISYTYFDQTNPDKEYIGLIVLDNLSGNNPLVGTSPDINISDYENDYYIHLTGKTRAEVFGKIVELINTPPATSVGKITPDRMYASVFGDVIHILDYRFHMTLKYFTVDNLIYTNDIVYQNKILCELSESTKIIEFFSKISGANGNEISIKFNKIKKDFYVSYYSRIIEEYRYTDLYNLMIQLNENSNYISCNTFTTSDINITSMISYSLSGYELEDFNTSRIIQLKESLVKFNDEDVIIDLFLYDDINDSSVVDLIKSLAKDKDDTSISIYGSNYFLPIFNTQLEDGSDILSDDNSLYTFGYVVFNGVLIPSSYFILEEISTNIAGIVERDISLVPQVNDELAEGLKSLGINYILYNNLIYYVQYLYSNYSDKNYGIIFTENKIISRYKELVKYLGADYNSTREVVLKLNNNLTSSTYLIKSIKIDKLTISEGVLDLTLSVATYDLIEEILRININIKK